MERQQGIVYQLDLFHQQEQGQEIVRPSHDRETVSGAEARKELQVEGAGEQERALANELMQVILSHDNISRAYKQVKQNKGVAGVGQMPVEKFAEWNVQEGENLIGQLQAGNYQPQGVKLAEIPKPNS